jgi:hypothetical protein
MKTMILERKAYMNLTCADCDNFAKSSRCAGCTNYSLFVPYNGITYKRDTEEPPATPRVLRPTETGKKFDSDKVDWTLMPWKELEQVLEVLEFGAKKYSRDNWKHIEPARYEKAAMRHLISYATGEKIDPESGKSHLAHLMCNALFLMWNDNDKSM